MYIYTLTRKCNIPRDGDNEPCEHVSWQAAFLTEALAMEYLENEPQYGRKFVLSRMELNPGDRYITTIDNDQKWCPKIIYPK